MLADSDPDIAILTQVVKSWDSQSELHVRPRSGRLLDVMVISERFDVLSSEEREREFWGVVQSLPESLAVRMTYSLLITRQEAEEYSFPTKETLR